MVQAVEPELPSMLVWKGAQRGADKRVAVRIPIRL